VRRSDQTPTSEKRRQLVRRSDQTLTSEKRRMEARLVWLREATNGGRSSSGVERVAVAAAAFFTNDVGDPSTTRCYGGGRAAARGPATAATAATLWPNPNLREAADGGAIGLTMEATNGRRSSSGVAVRWKQSSKPENDGGRTEGCAGKGLRWFNERRWQRLLRWREVEEQFAFALQWWSGGAEQRKK